MLLADLSHFDDGSSISDAGLWVVRFLVALLRLRSFWRGVCVCVIVYCDVVGFDVGIAPGSGTTIYPRLHPPIYHSLKKPIADSLTHSLTH